VSTVASLNSFEVGLKDSVAKKSDSPMPRSAIAGLNDIAVADLGEGKRRRSVLRG